METATMPLSPAPSWLPAARRRVRPIFPLTIPFYREFVSIIAPDKTGKGKDGAEAEQLPLLTGWWLCCELKGCVQAGTAAGVLLP